MTVEELIRELGQYPAYWPVALEFDDGEGLIWRDPVSEVLASGPATVEVVIR